MSVKQVRPGAAGRQTQPAKWRGLVEIRRLSHPPGDYLAMSLGDIWPAAILAHLEASRRLRGAMRGRSKAVFRATLLGDGTLDIREEVDQWPDGCETSRKTSAKRSRR